MTTTPNGPPAAKLVVEPVKTGVIVYEAKNGAEIRDMTAPVYMNAFSRREDLMAFLDAVATDSWWKGHDATAESDGAAHPRGIFDDLLVDGDAQRAVEHAMLEANSGGIAFLFVTPNDGRIDFQYVPAHQVLEFAPVPTVWFTRDDEDDEDEEIDPNAPLTAFDAFKRTCDGYSYAMRELGGTALELAETVRKGVSKIRGFSTRQFDSDMPSGAEIGALPGLIEGDWDKPARFDHQRFTDEMENANKTINDILKAVDTTTTHLMRHFAGAPDLAPVPARAATDAAADAKTASPPLSLVECARMAQSTFFKVNMLATAMESGAAKISGADVKLFSDSVQAAMAELSSDSQAITASGDITPAELFTLCRRLTTASNDTLGVMTRFTAHLLNHFANQKTATPPATTPAADPQQEEALDASPPPPPATAEPAPESAEDDGPAQPDEPATVPGPTSGEEAEAEKDDGQAEGDEVAMDDSDAVRASDDTAAPEAKPREQRVFTPAYTNVVTADLSDPAEQVWRGVLATAVTAVKNGTFGGRKIRFSLAILASKAKVRPDPMIPLLGELHDAGLITWHKGGAHQDHRAVVHGHVKGA